MKKIILFLISIVCFIGSNAQSITLHCETAGSLADTLTQKGLTNLSEIHSLTVSGHLHAGDFQLFKQMTLDSLNLSDVKIDTFFGVGTYAPGVLGSNSPRQYAEDEIPANAFSFRSGYNNSLSGMEDLVYMVLPTNLKSIASEAFAKTSLTAIDLPAGLENIDTDAFLGCLLLEEITIPASVSSIGGMNDRGTIYGAFADCESLRAIWVDEGNENFASVDGVLFSKDLTCLLQYPTGKIDTEYKIPNGTLRIAHQAFERNPFLEKVTLSASVELIERAFWYCDNLREIVCEGEIPADWYAIGMTSLVEAFDYELMKEGWLTVPLGCKAIYESNYYWGQFKNIRETETATNIETIETSSILIMPKNKQIHIRQDKNENMDILVYDTTGKLIQHIQNNGNEISIQVPQNGIYIVRINNTTQKCVCR